MWRASEEAGRGAEWRVLVRGGGLVRGVTLVQVVGPSGGGKTTLIERVLRSSPSRLLAAVRIVPDDAVRAPVLDPAGDADTVRYAAAGAWRSRRVRVPAGAPCDVLDVLDACEGAFHAASAVLIEGGAARRGDVDAIVFVTSPLERGVGLTVVETREVGRLDGRDALRLMAGLAPIASEEERADLDALEALDEGDDIGEVIDEFEIPDALGERILELLEHGYPVRQEVTELRPGFEGLPEAHLAVVSAGDAGGAGDAGSVAATLAAIAGLRADEALLRSLRRDHVRFGPRTVVAADLREPRDPGTRKALEAVKRRMRARVW
jgi:hypothetical protein